MKKIKWTWKKILVTTATVLGIGTLVSCYGMPNNDDYKYRWAEKGIKIDYETTINNFGALQEIRYYPNYDDDYKYLLVFEDVYYFITEEQFKSDWSNTGKEVRTMN